MNDHARIALRIILCALVLGALGDALLREIPWGINAALWMLALLAAAVTLAPFRPEAWKGGGAWLALPAVAFSAAFAWRDSPAIAALNILALVVTGSLAILRAQGGRVRVSSLFEYALGSVIAGLNAAFAVLPLVLNDVRWKELTGQRWSGRAMAFGRGVLLSVPPLLIFGRLFMGADAVFESLMKNVVHLNFQTLVKHGLVFTFLAWTTGGFLRGALLGKERVWVAEKRPQFFPLGIIETAVVLGLVDILFLSFVAVQVRYFFGGASLVQATTGLSYSEYARRGFFELVTVAALVLPLLLLAHWMLRKENAAHERLFRALAEIQILLLFVIMASAFERMRLYQQEYGLTEQRLYPTAFMAWLAIVFVWFAATVLRGRRESFAFGALVAGYVLIVTLHVLNPDALIARTNAARALEGRKFDARYAASLSADAVPELIAALPGLPTDDGCILATRILERWPPSEPADWRTWNRSRAEALRVIEENRTSLKDMACADKLK